MLGLSRVCFQDVYLWAIWNAFGISSTRSSNRDGYRLITLPNNSSDLHFIQPRSDTITGVPVTEKTLGCHVQSIVVEILTSSVNGLPWGNGLHSGRPNSQNHSLCWDRPHQPNYRLLDHDQLEHLYQR